MFDVYCEGHGGTTLVSSRSVIGVEQQDGRITLHLRCWCGYLVSHRTGAGNQVLGVDEAPTVVEPVPSMVAAVPPARSARAASHFSARLAYETDPADVWRDLQRGADRFVLLDARGAEAYREAHLPAAVSMPHAALDAATARRLLVDRDADLFVTYCWRPSCNAATKAAARLASFGLPVKEMLGGIEGWQAEGLPVVSGPHDEHPAATTTPEPQNHRAQWCTAC